MKIYLKYSLLIAFIFTAAIANAQLTRDLYKLYNPNYFNKAKLDTASFEPWRAMSPSKPSYSVEVGSSYSTFGGGLSSSYISPTVSFMATDKLHIVAGGKFSHTNMGSIPFLSNEVGQAQTQPMGGNPTEAFAYGHYQVNEKISVYGMGAFGKNQLYISPFQTGFNTGDYSHLSFGMDYKINDKVRIGASFGVSNGPAWGVTPFNSFSNQRMNPFFP